MSRDWEAQFREWAKPPGKTEEDRCNNALSAIRNAIKASDALCTRDVSVFAQGSYRNNTNVRKDSDVDIGVLCTDTFFFDLPENTTCETLGISPATYGYGQFKNEVGAALVGHFGQDAVKRGDKVFDVHETTYHVEADVAAFFEHRRYQIGGAYLSGVELRTDIGNNHVINWPDQNYANGCRKNTDTGMRFKSIVRVLKAMSNEMAERHVQAGSIPSFLIECLVWNVPNDRFQNSTYTADMKAALYFLYERTKTDELCREWGEVNELKYLFWPVQKWTRQQANEFTVAAWNYAELGE
ncbi:MAG TPA: nucleotidyltransferase [Candidatus Deferrimicrobium sp.]|nr:nucleotidyltransferase [Candidatus Deferrimicrobium sp.]